MGGTAIFTMDFGSGGTYVNEVIVTVPNLTGIQANSDVEANKWITSLESTADNDSDAHALAAHFITCVPKSISVIGNSCDVRCFHEDDVTITGTFKERLVWN